MTLAEFLIARIGEDERVAKLCAIAYPPTWDVADRGWMATVRADEPNFPIVVELDQKYAPKIEGNWLGDYVQHVARWDPARVLAECQAKRQIIRWLTDDTVICEVADPVMRLLALPYGSHPDYDEAWKL